MKFFNYVENTTGMSMSALLSMLVFVLFFTLMLVWVIKADKKKIDDISRIPLDNN